MATLSNLKNLPSLQQTLAYASRLWKEKVAEASKPQFKFRMLKWNIAFLKLSSISQSAYNTYYRGMKRKIRSFGIGLLEILIMQEYNSKFNTLYSSELNSVNIIPLSI